eukprot:5601628-Prymnesium_polylepis.1
MSASSSSQQPSDKSASVTTSGECPVPPVLSGLTRVASEGASVTEENSAELMTPRTLQSTRADGSNRLSPQHSFSSCASTSSDSSAENSTSLLLSLPAAPATGAMASVPHASVPTVPENVLERPELIAALKECVLQRAAGRNVTALTSAARSYSGGTTTAVGMGGVGKTVAAAAL